MLPDPFRMPAACTKKMNRLISARYNIQYPVCSSIIKDLLIKSGVHAQLQIRFKDGKNYPFSFPETYSQ